MQLGNNMPSIHIIATGGTIAAQKNADSMAEFGKVSSDSLLEGLAIPHDCELVIHDISAIDSSLMTFEILLKITHCIHSIFMDKNVLGIIVAHGTDTMEESAYFLSLCYPKNEKRPVIVTGSQRTGSEVGSDAKSNLQHALWAAASEACRGLGTAVLFNQALYMPKYVHKNHTHFLHAFTAQYYGMLGTVDEGNVYIAQEPRIQENFLPSLPFPKTDIYKASLNCTGDVLDFYAKNHYQAVIIEAFGRGNVTEELASNIKKLIDSGCYVIITSDCANGSVKALYDFCGGLGKLIEYGAIPAFDYSAKKARIKMAVLLAAGIAEKEQILSVFKK